MSENNFSQEMDCECIFSHYKLIRQIAMGSSAVIFEAFDLNKDHAKVCCKIVPKNDDSNSSYIEPENVFNEVEVLRRLNHRNIVKFIDFYEDEYNYYLVEELLNGKSLLDYINSKFENFETLNETVIKSIIEQLLDALKYMHKQGIAHRDIKPENIIVIEEKDKIFIKIVDFGLSTLNSDSFSDVICGSIYYIAPEILLNEKYIGSIADIWSAGVIFFTLLADRLPFENDNINILREKIINANYMLPLDIDNDAALLVSKMLNPIPSLRITASEALKSSYFIKDNASIDMAELKDNNSSANSDLFIYYHNNSFSSKKPESHPILYGLKGSFDFDSSNEHQSNSLEYMNMRQCI